MRATINAVFSLFREVSDHVSQSMPVGIGDRKYSGSVQLKEPTAPRTIYEFGRPRGGSADIGKIWRGGEWKADLEPKNMYWSPANYCRALFVHFDYLVDNWGSTTIEIVQKKAAIDLNSKPPFPVYL